jgi:hypothetical protein
MVYKHQIVQAAYSTEQFAKLIGKAESEQWAGRKQLDRSWPSLRQQRFPDTG